MISPKVHYITDLNSKIDSKIANIHTALPGEIIEVNADSGTAKVQPKAKMKFSGGRELDYPVIPKVPIVMPYSQNADTVIAYPVKAGDQCLIVFSEQALDSYLGTGTIGGQLKHSLNGAICIPGLMRKAAPEFKEAAREEKIIVKCKDTRLEVGADGVKITGNLIIDGEMEIVKKAVVSEDDEATDGEAS